MQPRFTVAILVLQAEGLVSGIRYLGFYFQTIPAGIVAEPQEVAVDFGHLARYTDLVVIEVVGLLADFSVFVNGASIGETAYVRNTHALRQELRFCVACSSLYIFH